MNGGRGKASTNHESHSAQLKLRNLKFHQSLKALQKKQGFSFFVLRVDITLFYKALTQFIIPNSQFIIRFYHR